MKLIALFMTTGLILTASSRLWFVAAQPPPPAPKALLRSDALADWQYPGAKSCEEANRECLPAIPLQGIHSQTTDPIDKVFLFYRKKCEPHFVANTSNTWQPESQPTMLMTQFGHGAQSANFFHSTRKDADSALMLIHELKRTITIQLSRDPKDKATTDILLIADEH